jgi:hypothetical protein
MEELTLIQISIDNKNNIRSSLDLTPIEHDEEALRITHSILDEHRQSVLDQINIIKAVKEIEDPFSEEL